MALLLPILLMVVFGITEFGRAWMTSNILHTAAREGARLAVVTGPDTTLVKSRVNQVLSAAHVTAKQIDISGPDATPERKVTVTVVTDFNVLSADALNFFGQTGMAGTFELRASTTMRHEAF